MSSPQQPRNEKKSPAPWLRLGDILKRRRKKSDPFFSTRTSLPKEATHDEAEAFSTNPWSIISGILFLGIVGLLLSLCVLMWIPRSLDDVKGAYDDTPVHDLFSIAGQAGATPNSYSFSESELNRYLKKTCRMRQGGPLSIIAHPSQVSLKIHDGYGELIISRIVGSHMRHTISVYLSFAYSGEHAERHVSLQLQAGDQQAGIFPEGGRIGLLPIPHGYMQMMIPSLESLLDVYPELATLVQDYDFLPVFQRKDEDSEGHLLLLPPPSDIPLSQSHSPITNTQLI